MPVRHRHAACASSPSIPWRGWPPTFPRALRPVPAKPADLEMALSLPCPPLPAASLKLTPPCRLRLDAIGLMSGRAVPSAKTPRTAPLVPVPPLPHLARHFACSAWGPAATVLECPWEVCRSSPALRASVRSRPPNRCGLVTFGRLSCPISPPSR